MKIGQIHIKTFPGIYAGFIRLVSTIIEKSRIYISKGYFTKGSLIGISIIYMQFCTQFNLPNNVSL